MNDNEHKNNLRDVVRRCVSDQGRIALITQSVNNRLRDYALSPSASTFPNTEDGIRELLTTKQRDMLTQASYKTLRNKFLFANAIIAFANKYPDSRPILAQGGLEDCYRTTKGKAPKSGQFAALVVANRLIAASEEKPATAQPATAQPATAQPATAQPKPTKAKPAKVKVSGPVALDDDNISSAVAVLNSAAGKELAEAPRQILLGAAKILLSIRDAAQ